MATERDGAHADWSFDSEIVGFVEMARSQIALALREAEAPIGELGSAIAGIGVACRRIQRLAGEDGPDALAELEAAADQIAASVRDASVALQFHDRLAQRLAHAREALEVLAGAVADRHGHHTPAAWDRLRDGIRAQYSMDQERVIFDLLVGGATPERVLDTLRNLHDAGAPGHVDLF